VIAGTRNGTGTAGLYKDPYSSALTGTTKRDPVPLVSIVDAIIVGHQRNKVRGRASLFLIRDNQTQSMEDQRQRSSFSNGIDLIGWNRKKGAASAARVTSPVPLCSGTRMSCCTPINRV